MAYKATPARLLEELRVLRERNAELEAREAERARVEEALRISETRFRLLVDQSPWSIQIYAPDGRPLQVNRAWEELWGVTLDQIPEYNILADPQLEAKGIMGFIRRAFAGEAVESPPIPYDPNETLPDRTRHADPLRWTRALIYPVKDDNGSIREVVLIHEDITERINAEEALRFQKSLLELQSEASIDGILVASGDGTILSYNRRFVELWEIPEDVIALRSDAAAIRAVQDKLVDPDAFLAQVSYLYAHPDEESRDEIRLKDGRTIERYSAPVKANDGVHYGRAWFFRDITERKRAEQERADLLAREQTARAEAEAALVLRDQFLSVAAHELRTPVTTLLAYSQMIGRRLVRGAPAGDKDRRALETMSNQAQRLSQLISSLLDISRIESGLFPIERGRFDLGMLAQRVLDEVQPQLNKHIVELQKPPEPVTIMGDELRLEQVLQNLVQNAIKYSPDGGRITVQIGRRGQSAVISVTDQGIGIPEAAHSELFQRYYRAGNAAESGIAGLGIGLYVVQEIVKRHGGTLEVASTEGEGSTFTILLPQDDGVV